MTIADNTKPRVYKQRLVVQVVYHPAFAARGDMPGGRELAEHLYSLLTRDIDEPLARGIFIPVFFRSAAAPGKSVPADFALDDAQHTVVVVLIDDKMINAPGWGDYVAGVVARVNASNDRHRVIPVWVSPSARNLDRRVNATNAIHLFDDGWAGVRLPVFAIAVVHELCRVLKAKPSCNAAGVMPRVNDEDRVRIFISHTKAGDSKPVVDRLYRALLPKYAARPNIGALADRIVDAFDRYFDNDPTQVPFDEFQRDAKDGSYEAMATALRDLFGAYVKVDRGKKIATEINNYIATKLQLATFFDVHDILYGEDFAKSIKDYIDRSALLIVQTDAYAGRVWCQIEVLLAKRHLRPVLVVNAVRSGERRAFPYLGNVPTIRFSAGSPSTYPTIVAQMLLEVLRTLHFKLHFDDLRALYDIDPDIQCLTLSPELLTLLDLRRKGEPGKRFVYPDPPLSDDELALLHEFDTDLTVTTPVFLLGTHAKSTSQAAPETTESTGPTPKLSNRTVALSVGDTDDLGPLGLNTAHLEQATLGLSRYLLASGAALAYGGDFRAGGYTEHLLDLVRMYNSEASTGQNAACLRSFLAWPLQVTLPDEEKARYKGVAEFIEVAPPADLGVNRNAPPGWTSPADLYVRARCFTAMRERMNARGDGGYLVDARVVLGGRLTNYKGKYPGLLEEAYLAIRDGVPLYLVGGFGGCTRRIIQALLGATPRRQVVGDEVSVVLDPLSADALDELTLDFQLRNNPGYTELVEQYRQSAAGPIDYPAVVNTLRTAGLVGLNNGLSDEENLRLFTTPFIVEMIQLVLLGLSRARYRTSP